MLAWFTLGSFDAEVWASMRPLDLGMDLCVGSADTVTPALKNTFDFMNVNLIVWNI